MELRALLPRRDHIGQTKSFTRVGRRKALLYRSVAVTNRRSKGIGENVSLLSSVHPDLSLQHNPGPSNESEAESPVAFKVDAASITPNLYGISEGQAPIPTQPAESRTLSELVCGQQSRTLNFKQIRRPPKVVRALLPRSSHRKRGLSVTGRPLTPARLGKDSGLHSRRRRSQQGTTSTRRTHVRAID